MAKHKVFLCWSGVRSRAAATAFREWLPSVLQNTTPWMSDTDLEAGADWNLETRKSLQQSRLGVVFLTPTNVHSDWLHFEMGALAKALDDQAFVCPYLFGLDADKIPPGPLKQFQAKNSDKAGTLDLIRTLNLAIESDGVEAVEKVFETWWPVLEKVFEALPADESGLSVQPGFSEEAISGIVSLVREQAAQTSGVRDSCQSSDEATETVLRLVHVDLEGDPSQVDRFLGHVLQDFSYNISARVAERRGMVSTVEFHFLNFPKRARDAGEIGSRLRGAAAKFGLKLRRTRLSDAARFS